MSVDYAITVTLKSKCHKFDIERQYDIMKFELMKFHYDVDQRATFVIELTKSYNIHAHGIVKILELHVADYKRKIYDYFRNNVRIGFILVTDITDFNKWVEYITKDVKETKLKLFLRSPILIDDYECIPQDILFQAP